MNIPEGKGETRDDLILYYQPFICKIRAVAEQGSSPSC